MVDPGGNIRRVVIGALTGDGIDQHGSGNVRAAEQADGLPDPGAHPEGVAVLVDLKGRGVEQIGGVAEPQIAVQIPAEVLGRGVADALIQAHHVHVLGHHVDDQIRRQTLGAVVQPLDPVAVAQGRHPHRAALVVDLGIIPGYLELGHHVRQLAQLAVAQLLGGVLVQHGNLVIADLLHLGGKVAGLHRQQVPVGAGPEHLPADGRAHNGRDCQRRRQHKGHGALLFHEAEVALGSAALKAGGQNGAAAVYRAQQQHEHIEFAGMQVQRRQHDIEINGAEDQRHRQVQQRPPHGGADGPALFFWPVGHRPAPLEGVVVPAVIHEKLSFLAEGGGYLFSSSSIAFPARPVNRWGKNLHLGLDKIVLLYYCITCIVQSYKEARPWSGIFATTNPSIPS